ncbi:MAG: YlqD family protein [Cyanobacteria bacterium J06639_1]
MADLTPDSSSLLLKRNVTIRVTVTERWKAEMQENLQKQVQNVDNQMQQLEFQGKRAIAEIEKRTIQPAGPEAAQQIQSITAQVNAQKGKLLEQKNQALQQLNQVGGVELGQEVIQGNVESFFNLKEGDNLIEKMQVELLLEDGVVKEIRGSL